MTTYININGELRDASSLSVPSDRTFRGAWEFNGPAIEVDMEAAKVIHKDNLRAERKPKLEALDVEFMLAFEKGEDPSTIVAAKVALRGVTSDARIEEAATPEELVALSLEALI